MDAIALVSDDHVKRLAISVNSGVASNVTTVASLPMFLDSAGKAFVVPAERSLRGSADFEDRNDDWDNRTVCRAVR